MRTILVFSLLCNLCLAENFVGPQEFTTLAEKCRVTCASFWGYQMPNWSQPCVMIYTPQYFDGGNTTFVKVNNTTTNFKMEIGRDYEAVIPHEVDHAVRHSIITHQLIPRWLDEGCAAQFEPVRRQDSYIQLAKQNKMNVRTSTLENMDYQPDANNNMLLYAFGYTAVQVLLERDTPQTLICFQADSRSMNERFKTYYGMSSEQFMETWRNKVDTMQPVNFVPYPANFPVIDNRPVLAIWVSQNELSNKILQDIQKEPLKSYLINNYHTRVVTVNPLTSAWANLNWITQTPTVVIPALRKQFADYTGPEDLISRLGGNPRPYVREEEKPLVQETTPLAQVDDNTVLPPDFNSTTPVTQPTITQPTPIVSDDDFDPNTIPGYNGVPTKSPTDSPYPLCPDDLQYWSELRKRMKDDKSIDINDPSTLPKTLPIPKPSEEPVVTPTPTPVVTPNTPPITTPTQVVTTPHPIPIAEPTENKRSWGDFGGKLLGLAGDTVITLLPFLVGSGVVAGTGGAGLLLFHGLPLLIRLMKRGGASSTFQVQRNPIEEGLLPRNLEEVRSILELARKEGHVPLLECFRGLTYNDEITKLLEGDLKPEQKNVLLELKRVVEEIVQKTAPISTKI